MDTKSLAKSKRAHSQHHSRNLRHNNNPKPKSKPSSAKPLNSNWDRYEEEEQDQSVPQNPSDDVVLPKSKGADYRHLIAEAQSQPSNLLPSVADLLTDEFGRAVGSMLSVRGEGILAWSGDDNFVVDDQTTAHPQASFLCLNLHALAEQLEKIDLAQRLFIEEDLLPPELRTEVSEASKAHECAQIPATSSSVPVRQPIEDLTFIDSSAKIENVGQASNITSFNNSTVRGNHSDPSQTLRGFSSVSGSIPQSSMNSSVGPEKTPPKFEAAAAEAELDMLLDSFNEIEILGSPSFSSADTISVRNETSVATFEHPRKNRDLPALSTSSLDDDLDDLLNVTSNLSKNSNLIRPKTGRVEKDQFVQPSSSKLSETKSKTLDDFDSWLDTF